MRDTFAIAIIAVVVLLIVALIHAEHRSQGYAMPMVKAAAPVCIPPMSHYQFKQRRIA